MDLMNELQYMFGTQGVLDGRTQKDTATDKYQPNLLQRAIGVTGEQMQQAGQIKDTRELKRDFNGQLKLYGAGEVQQGEQRSDVEARLFKAKEDYADDKDSDRRTKEFMDPNRVEERRVAGERYTDQRQDVANQMELTRLQMAKGDKRYLLEMADRKDERAMDREDRRARERKEDLRYNESIDRADRKDRRQSMQTLVAGLANLGAAFAY